MEYCNGGDLKDLLEAKDWKLPYRVIHKIMRQITWGYKAMIENLVLHRDLKLQNIMVHFNGQTTYLMDLPPEEKKEFLKNVDLLDTDFQVKIADFGLSRKVESKNAKLRQQCGTMYYMSPQLLTKEKYSYKCDIWAIGIILYWMLEK